MQKVETPKNQFSQAVRLLIDYNHRGVTMKEAMQDHFHKFQTRLLELEKVHPKIKIRRLKMTRKNRFGHSCTFTNYKSMANYVYLCNLLVYLNKNGLK